MPKRPAKAIFPIELVQQRILILRGQRVILAADLAALYGVPTKRLNEAVKRNAERFPEDFVFKLTKAEAQAASRSQIATLNDARDLKSQFAASKRGRNMKYIPYAFTEHGAIMAATVLSSPRAVAASLFVVRAFVKLRELLSSQHQLAEKLAELERKLQDHDGQILAIIDAIRQLMEGGEDPDDPAKPPIGFHTEIASPPPATAKRKKRHAPKA